MPPSYWAKLTEFPNGGFELAVVNPPSASHHTFKEPYRGKFGAVIYPVDKIDDKTQEEKAVANLARSVRRSRQKVRHTIKALQADHLVTLTYRENMQDVDLVKSHFKKFHRMMSARLPDWHYVCVKETQERGAIHLHLAVKGRQNLNYLRKCWYIAIGGSSEDVGEHTKGAVNVRAPSRRMGRTGKSSAWKIDKLAGYLTKYLGKEFEGLELHHAKRYWHSKAIPKPVLQKFWLGATNFKDAVVESHNLVYFRGAKISVFWAAGDYRNIYLSGVDLCPF